MVLNQSSEIKLGEEQVKAVYLGDKLLWVMDERFVSVTPEVVWLVDENDMEVVEVTSNTEWNTY